MFQRLFFVFSVLALLIVSLNLKKVIEYKNKALVVFLLSAFAVCMYHSVALKTPSIVYNYLFFTFMVEGFFYILAGVLLFWLTVTYSKKFNIIYPVIFLNLINFVVVVLQLYGISKVPSICGMMGTKSQLALFSAVSIPLLLGFRVKGVSFPLYAIPIFNLVVAHSFSPIFALAIGTLIYLRIYRKKIRNTVRMAVIVITSSALFLLNSKELIMKLRVRWDLIQDTIFQIWYSPIFGSGFDNGLTMNKMYAMTDNDYAYRHNDFLNFAHDMGLPLALSLSFIILRIIKGWKADYTWISAVVFLVGCLIQTNFYFPCVAVIGIFLLATLERNRLCLIR